MLKRSFLSILLFLSFMTFVFGGEPFRPWSVGVSPGGRFPLGEDAGFFSIGGGGEVDVAFRFPGLPLLKVQGAMGYSVLPVEMDTSISILSWGAGGGVAVNPVSWMVLSLDCVGGYYFSLLNDGAGPKSGYPFILPTASVHFHIAPAFSLGVSGSYRNYFGMYQGAEVSLGVRFYFGGRGGEKAGPVEIEPVPLKEAEQAENLRITGSSFQDIFPVFFKYYDDHPFGTAALINNADETIENIKIGLYIRQYMDAPKVCRAPSSLGPGREGELELNALLTEKVLEITESTKATAEISVEYAMGGEIFREKYVETVRLYDRNATTWDDDRKVAAFVTAKDPAVLTFAKNVAGITGEIGKGAVNPNLRSAMALHGALKLFGMNYVIDPKTPYRELSETAGVVDFLQFPRQSLQYKAGDCDDLSILTNSLLESIGIETAFITVPGHIFTAFSLGITPEEAKKIFLRVEDLIFHDDTAWVPVEITQVQDSFLEAWATGAKEWREGKARDTAGFYPTHEAWQIYEPVGLPGDPSPIAPPQREKVEKVYFDELTRFVEKEIYPRTAEIEEQISKQGETPKLYNKLGLLYARYGLAEKAGLEFDKALSLDPGYVPSLVNMGNLQYLAGNPKEALRYYRNASQIRPDNPTVLLGIARANHDLENYGLVDESYNRLKEVRPDLARRFVYLDMRGSESEKAAAIGSLKEEMVWEED